MRALVRFALSHAVGAAAFLGLLAVLSRLPE